MKLQDIMTAPAEFVEPSAGISEVADKMRVHDIGFVPVCDENGVCGVITDRDIVIRAVAQGRLPTTPAKDVMTSHPCCLKPDTEAEEACDVMKQEQIRRIVVTDEDNQPLGVVSLRDLALCLDAEEVGEVLQEVSKE